MDASISASLIAAPALAGAESLTPAGVALLAAIACLAGIINTMAGGGGLLVLPALVWFGLPAGVANGTMRVGVLLQNIGSTLAFRREKLGDLGVVRRLLPAMVVGAALGTWAATELPDDLLRPIFGAILVAWAVVLVVRPGRVLDGAHDPRPPGWPSQVASLAIGVYGGFLQAGVGFPLLALLISGLGYGAVPANAIKVVLVLGFTAVSLPLFAWAGQVDWAIGAVLGVGSVVGGWLGALIQVRSGAALVRWVLVVAMVASGALMASGR